MIIVDYPAPQQLLAEPSNMPCRMCLPAWPSLRPGHSIIAVDPVWVGTVEVASVEHLHALAQINTGINGYK